MSKDKPINFKYFPYPKTFKGQQEGMEAIYKSSKNSGTLLLNSPTGTGKTAMVISAIAQAAKDSEKIVVLTRTHSQYESFIRETALMNKTKNRISCGFLAGKESVCPAQVSRRTCAKAQHRAIKNLKNGMASKTNLDMIHVRSHSMKKEKKGMGCPYFINTYEWDSTTGLVPTTRALALVASQITNPKCLDDFTDRCVEQKQPYCPYEIMKYTLQDAKVLVLHYLYFIDRKIHEIMYSGGWIGAEPSQTHIVVDEAHNFPQYIVENSSETTRLTEISESIAFIDEHLDGKGDFDLKELKIQMHSAKNMLEEIVKSLNDWLAKKAGSSRIYDLEEDHVLQTQKLSSIWFTDQGQPAFGFDTLSLDDLNHVAAEVQKQFESFAQKKDHQEFYETPTIVKCSKVLTSFAGTGDEKHIKHMRMLAGQQETLNGNPQETDILIRIAPCDPRDEIEHMRENCKSLTLISGTLTPLDLFKKHMFKEEMPVETVNIENPFPKENRKVIAVEDITTLYRMREDPANKRAITKLIEAMAGVKGKVGIYFPSYDLLHKWSPKISAVCRLGGKKAFIEDRNTNKKKLIKQYMESKNAMLAGVCRGSLSEGVDFPHHHMVAAAVVGLPFAKRSKLQEKIEQYWQSHGLDGLRMTYILPSIIASTQAIGRCIRSETDRGVLILADNRFMQPQNKDMLPKWISDEIEMVRSDELADILDDHLGSDYSNWVDKR